MKKKALLIFMLAVISVASFYLMFYRENYSQSYKMKHAEQTSSSFQISISAGNKSHDEIYSILKKLLDKFQGNIYFSRTDKNSKKGGVIKYIYLTDLHYFDNFVLEHGRFLTTNELESDKYLSTVDRDDSAQIGKIMDFAGDDIFEIRTLKSMVEKDTGFDGNAVLQLENTRDIDFFIDELNQDGIYCRKEVSTSGPPPSFMYIFSMVLLMLYIVLLILVFYNILSSYKKIGIYKMFGYKNSTVWLNSALPVMLQQIIIFYAVCAVAVPIAISEFNSLFWNFVFKLVLQGLIIFSLTFIFASLPFLYLPRVTIPNMLKNKRPVKEIIITNTVIKTILSVFLFFHYLRFIPNILLFSFGIPVHIKCGKLPETMQLFQLSAVSQMTF